MIRIGILLTVMAACVAAASGAVAGEADTGDFDRAFAEVAELRARAAEIGHEWLGTGKLLQAAREAAASGDMARANQLLLDARADCVLALEQAGREEVAWKTRVLR
jgi:hypothetical protein